ncbi:MAG: hypothetical protein AB7V08_13480 [Elusimicrobiales bacterium]
MPGGDSQVYSRDGEVIVYKQAGNSVKEWIYVPTPPNPDALSYGWDFVGDDKGRRITLRKRADGGVGIYSVLPVAGVPEADEAKRLSVMQAVNNAFRGRAAVEGDRLLAEIPPPVYWTASGVKKSAEFLLPSEGRLVLRLEEEPSSYPLLIDPTLNYGQWLGGGLGGGPVTISAIAFNAASEEIYVGGFGELEGGMDESVSFSGQYSGGNEGFVAEVVDGVSPSLSWAHWLGGTGEDKVLAVAVNGDQIYVAGYSDNATSWETPLYGSHSGSDEGFLAQITDGASPTLNWVQWLGGTGDDYVRVLAVTGGEIYAAGDTTSATSWETVTTTGTYSGLSEGFLIEISSGSSPSLNWMRWLGGTGNDYVRGVAVTGDEIYVVGEMDTTAGWEGTFSGVCAGVEIFLAEIGDASNPTLNWNQCLGSSGNDYAAGVAVNGDQIYVVGHSTSTLDWEITFTGTVSGMEAFCVNVQDGPTVIWGQWVGGNANEYATAVAVSGTEVYISGYTNNGNGWDAVTVIGAYSGGDEGFVTEMTDNGATGTCNWRAWLGGSSDDYIYSIAVNVDEFYAAGTSYSSASWETITFQGIFSGDREGFAVEIADAATPVFNWGQWLGGAVAYTYLTGVVAAGDRVYVSGYSETSLYWETITSYGTHSGGYEAFVVSLSAGGTTPALDWLQWLGGSSNETNVVLALDGAELYVAGTTGSSSSWEVTPSGSFGGSSGGFVAKLSTGAVPAVNWVFVMGATAGGTTLNAFAVNGDELYAAGSCLDNATSWSPLVMTGSHSGKEEAWIAEISGGAAPALVWGQWLGGNENDYVYSLAVSGDSIFAGGLSRNSWSGEIPSVTAGAYSGGDEGFVVKLADGVSPSISWLQWLGGSGDESVRALALNGTQIYAGGGASAASWSESLTFQGVHSGGTEGFVLRIDDAATPSLRWGQWLGGSGTDNILALALTGNSVYAGGGSSLATGWESFPFQGTHSGENEGFVVELCDDGTAPSANWAQWLGGTNSDSVLALSEYGGSVYAAGSSMAPDSWETVSFQGSNTGTQDGFLVKILPPSDPESAAPHF